jgi:hypothetical protein
VKTTSPLTKVRSCERYRQTAICAFYVSTVALLISCSPGSCSKVRTANEAAKLGPLVLDSPLTHKPKRRRSDASSKGEERTSQKTKPEAASDEAPPGVDDARVSGSTFPLSLTEKRDGSTIRLFSNSVVYITEEAKMPNVQISNPTTFDYEFTLVIEPENDSRVQYRSGIRHESFSRKELDSFPRPSEQLGQSVIGKGKTVDLFGLIPSERHPLGGRATLTIPSLNRSVSFSVRGRNPSREAVISEVRTLFQDDSYYALCILIQESMENEKPFNQFHSWKSVTSRDFPRTLPKWGFPDGWGMAQIDYAGEKINGKRRQVPTEALWNWKENLKLFRQKWDEKIRWSKRFHRRLEDAFGEDQPQPQIFGSRKIHPQTVSAIIAYNGVGPRALAYDSDSSAWTYIDTPKLTNVNPRRYKKFIGATWEFLRPPLGGDHWKPIDNSEEYWKKTKKRSDSVLL